MFPFPTNSVEFTFREKTGVNTFGDDIFTESTERVSGVILAPDSTSDQAEPRENLDEIIVELHLPKKFTKSVANATFVALDGPFTGRLFRVEGDSLPFAYSPLPWNRQVRAVEVYR